ncbi:hypothetical protein [Lysinibacillus irui]|uniref:Uncharacterized protein n=2 Tax=Lysinibacillus TaxID=400634 RepID=A0AAJ5UXB6_9BACI|nr:hypothetical protein [Lysinibacillus irui]WDV08697.1 hypothetical protein OU989_09545 [Lysinibacillus irui]
MLKRKDLFSFIMLLFFAFGFNSIANAEENNELSSTQKEHMRQLGFSEQIIESMTLDEYSHYENSIPVEPFVQTETIYKITSDQDGEVKKVEQFNEVDGLQKMNLENYSFPAATAASCSGTICTETTSWMSMTTTATKLGNGRTMLHNNFTWLKNPNVTLTDMVGLTYNDSAVIEPSTIKFSYKWKDGVGDHSRSYKDMKKSPQGLAATFDIQGIGTNAGASNHHGYISVEVSKGNKNDVSANAFGHYTHTTFSFNITVTIKTGDIGLGATTAETKMTSTAIKFNF